jgi:MinD superfamily P-loop ATPase
MGGAAILGPSPLRVDLKAERCVSEPESVCFPPWRKVQFRCEACEDCDVVEPCEALRESVVKRGSLVREYGWK